MSAQPHPDQFVAIEFDQPRRLFFGLKAIRALDRTMGEVGIARVLDLLRNLNFQTLERVLWAGMLHDEPMLTVNLIAKRLETFTDAGGDTTELFRAAYRAVNDSGVFGGADRSPGNVPTEQAS